MTRKEVVSFFILTSIHLSVILPLYVRSGKTMILGLSNAFFIVAGILLPVNRLVLVFVTNLFGTAIAINLATVQMSPRDKVLGIGMTLIFFCISIFIAKYRALNRRLKEELKIRGELEEFRDRVEQIMRHDLKAPLQGVIALPSVFASSKGLSSDEQEYIALVADAGQTMLNLIESSLLLLRVENGTIQIELEPAQIGEVAATVTTHLRMFAEQKQLVLRVEVPEPLGGQGQVAMVDRDLLYSALSNLLKNAIEASPLGEIIVVRIGSTDTRVTVAIVNKGEVPAEIRPRFFDKYITQGKVKGTGLGTYSAKLMIDAMGGHIGFTSSDGYTEVECQLEKAGTISRIS
jgi:signal transduction histidine kinase